MNAFFHGSINIENFNYRLESSYFHHSQSNQAQSPQQLNPHRLVKKMTHVISLLTMRAKEQQPQQ